MFVFAGRGSNFSFTLILTSCRVPTPSKPTFQILNDYIQHIQQQDQAPSWGTLLKITDFLKIIIIFIIHHWKWSGLLRHCCLLAIQAWQKSPLTVALPVSCPEHQDVHGASWDMKNLTHCPIAACFIAGDASQIESSLVRMTNNHNDMSKMVQETPVRLLLGPKYMEMRVTVGSKSS